MNASSAENGKDKNGNKMSPPIDLALVREEEFEKANIAFSGCGFLGIYHIGVISCLKQHAPRYLQHFTHFGGASAGALSACTLMFNMDLESCVQFVMMLAGKARNNLLGPISRGFDPVAIIRKTFMRFLPENAHEAASGKLHISMTRVSDWQNVIVSDYSSKEELVDALVCTSFVPFYSGVKPPTFRGVSYVDGGFTDNLPQHFEGTTITVSPFSGESDICPDDSNMTLFHFDLRNTSVQFTSQNLYRMSRAFFPPSQEVLSDMCRQGFKDALKYLHLHYPEMLNISVTRVRIPDCCKECQESEEEVSGCSCSTAEPVSDSDSTVSVERLFILHHVTPEVLNEVLRRAGSVITESDVFTWHLVKVFLRIARWIARPCIYTLHHVLQFSRELANSLIPKLQELSEKNYYTKLVVNIAMEIFNTYKDSYQCEKHPSLKDADFVDMKEATAKLMSIQSQLRVVPVEETSSWVPISSNKSMSNLPRRKTSYNLKPPSPTKVAPPVENIPQATPSSSRPVTPPNMEYLGLSPCTDEPLSSPLSKKSLQLLIEAGEFDRPGKIFRVGSCKSFDSTGGRKSRGEDSFDEFVSDFVLVDEESDCDFH